MIFWGRSEGQQQSWNQKPGLQAPSPGLCSQEALPGHSSEQFHHVCRASWRWYTVGAFLPHQFLSSAPSLCWDARIHWGWMLPVPKMNSRTTWWGSDLPRERYVCLEYVSPLLDSATLNVFYTTCSTPQPQVIQPEIDAQGLPMYWLDAAIQFFSCKSLK